MADSIVSASSTKSRSKKRANSEREPNSKKRKLPVVVHQNEDREQQDHSIFDFPEDDDDRSRSPPNSENPRKKQRRGDANTQPQLVEDQVLDTSKPSALFEPKGPRDWTLSIALPGSILTNFKQPDQKTALAGRIARAAAVFNVDEVVIFDDDPSTIPDYVSPKYRGKGLSKEEVMNNIGENDLPWQHPDWFLSSLLSYAEYPPYARKDCFGMQNHLKWVGLLPSLDMPHHLKETEWCRYREGIAIEPVRPTVSGKAKTKARKSENPTHEEQWMYVKCGLPFPVKVSLPVYVQSPSRVTLKFANRDPPASWPNLSKAECEGLKVEAVSPSTPREEEGYYWGYAVRCESSLANVIEHCEFSEGYDVMVGTSERGVPLESVLPSAIAPRSRVQPQGVKELPPDFKHLLIVFGGVKGLEPAVASDPTLTAKGLTKATAYRLFDAWVNLVQGQGSRTIRTEEAVEFGLFGLKGYVDSMYKK